MWPVYLAENLPEAQLLVHRLQARGIRTFVRNESLQGALGEIPLTARPEVCVLDHAALPDAQAVVQEYKADASSKIRQDELECSHCGEVSPGNFELCWKCGNPLATR
jgi:hypothetical protein